MDRLLEAGAEVAAKIQRGLSFRKERSIQTHFIVLNWTDYETLRAYVFDKDEKQRMRGDFQFFESRFLVVADVQHSPQLVNVPQLEKNNA